MRQTILNQDIPLSNNKRLIKRLWKVTKSKNYPDGLEFSYQFLYMKDKEWIQIARIDNQLHEGKEGTHIHVLKRKVRWADISFEEAEQMIIKLAEKVIKNEN